MQVGCGEFIASQKTNKYACITLIANNYVGEVVVSSNERKMHNNYATLVFSVLK